jgi:hypothetical protein
LKPFKFPSIALTLVIVLAACSLPGGASSPPQMNGQTPLVSPAATPWQANSTQTEPVAATPTDAPTALASAVLMTIVPNTPTWSVYNYTCQLATGGATMTMNLAWKDRSTSESGYRVYRDKQVIATLPANSTAYVDVVLLATGKTVSYSVEAFSPDWQFSTPTVTYGCQ